ncbi:beta-1,3-galactosyltransferase 6-like isoform X2 [Neocloeon triangulifer]|uniref:beta-1,3-galactosyltransferase 6-like isoform X2 n=1 Tax=Neocloeon triangulifer TaxID=2078957 RepID=UPI00286ECCC1|nr:beta-1,3-galactosyltransferase 6-like isoform X2 [Neocloeon triangulifer]
MPGLCTMRDRTALLLCLGSFLFGCMLTLNLIALDSAAKPKKQSELTSSEQQNLLIVLVLSKPENYAQRNVIRETWASEAADDAVCLFVLGKGGDKNHLRHEVKQFDDLLFVDVQDRYDSLTTKVLQAFEKVTSHYNYRFLLKCDDDSFVRLSALKTELQTASSPLYWGYFRGDARIKTSGKWRETKWDICDRYLPYAHGGGYVLSSDLVSFLARNVQMWRRFNSEDISVGTWLAAVEARRRHDRRFDTEHRSRGCSNSYLVTHKQSPEQMKALWRQLKEKGKMCETEETLVPGFEYNWNVPPSKCCNRAGDGGI